MKTHLNDLFDQMEPEIGNKLDDKIQVEESPKFKEICEIVEKSIKIGDLYYNLYLESLKNISANDITYFFSNYQNQISDEYRNLVGGYVNYLIQHSCDQDHTLLLTNMNNRNAQIGKRNNNKNIKLIGNIENEIGTLMKSGRIELNGNSNSAVGDRMKGGEIIVNGGACVEVGFEQKGGKITIHGNARFRVGVRMIGGEIIVKNLLSPHKPTYIRHDKLDNGYTRITPIMPAQNRT